LSWREYLTVTFSAFASMAAGSTMAHLYLRPDLKPPDVSNRLEAQQRAIREVHKEYLDSPR